ncbi:DNA polymerase III subunit gamma/tau [Patescibacteria group bacterium]|nr:DNA polymerase III subunit gamma/tau [Patescibacteria group bacterium]
MATLSRKYRPKTFKQVIGQNHIKTSLESEIINNDLAQAYLFCGPRAVGKTTLARILAKSLNCLNRKEGESEPCNECSSCLNINKNKSIEVIEIDAASHTGVDNVRENIINSARVAPTNLKYKVFIVDEVHMLSISAFNALLKVIEEPPQHVVFILCTTEVHKIPATVISRCERMDFKRLNISDTVQKLQSIVDLEEISVDKGVLETIARHSGGYLRDAESLLGQVISLSSEKKISTEQANLILPQSDILQAVKYLNHIASSETAKAIRLVNNLIDSGIDLNSFLADILQILRKLIVEKVNAGLSQSLGLDFGESIEKEILSLSTKLDIEKIAWYIDNYIKTNESLKNAQIKQLPLELVSVKLAENRKTYSSDNYKNNESGGNNFKQKNEDSTNSLKKDNINNNQVNNYNFTENNINKEKKEEEKINKDKEVEIEKEEEKELNIKEDDLAEKIDINIDDIQAKWREFILKIKSENHSLTFILQNCWPSEVKDGIINLKCKYKFHQDRLKDANIQDVINKNLYNIFKLHLKYITNIDSNLEVPRSRSKKEDKSEEKNIDDSKNEKIKKEKAQVDDEQKGAINNILNAFGGEVIS